MLDKKKIQPNLTHHISLDMVKQAGRVGSRVKTGHGSKRVDRVAGQTGRELSQVASRVKLTRIFQNFFFFF